MCAVTEFQRLRERLCEAGCDVLDFDSAWRHAGASTNGDSMLAQTREGWRRAYQREPATDAERAVGVLAGADLGFELVEE